MFICVEDAQAAEQRLADFGLQFELHAVHGGQGTANACAFFDNAYLELLSRHDDRELQSPAVQPLSLWERLHWRQTGASPFGIAFRTGEAPVPIETWTYHAAFLPSGHGIPIVTPANSARAPLVFLITPALPIRLRQPRPHRGQHRRLTRVTVAGPGVSALPAAAVALGDSGAFAISQASEHSLVLEWDGAPSGEAHDFAPMLPLVLRW